MTSLLSIPNDILNQINNYTYPTDAEIMEYKKEWDIKQQKLIYAFYEDIFQNRKMRNMIFGMKFANVIARGARDMQLIYHDKKNDKMVSHINWSLYVD